MTRDVAQPRGYRARTTSHHGPSMTKLLAAPFAAVLLAVPSGAAAPEFTGAAPIAFMEDLSTGAVLYARDADRRMPPASMAKMSRST